MTARFIPDLIDIEQELFELPPKVRRPTAFIACIDAFRSQTRVIYTRSVQTTEVETKSPEVFEEEIRQRVLKERDVEAAEQAARDKELEEEALKLDREIEQEIRGKLANLSGRL